MDDTISRQAAIELAMQYCTDDDGSCSKADRDIRELLDDLENLPSAQPEIIRCNACRHWHQTVGKMEGFGLGDCDYLEKKLVTCNGYCYWAERRTE